jgi:hypothetical protein
MEELSENGRVFCPLFFVLFVVKNKNMRYNLCTSNLDPVQRFAGLHFLT